MKNFVRVLFAVIFCVLLSASAFAQQPVPPPPQPAADSQANSEVLKLLRQGVSERVVLHVIAASTGRLDASPGALAALKQAGATDAEINAILAQNAAPAVPPPAAAPANGGPSLAATLQFIQDKLNNMGKIAFTMTEQKSSTGQQVTGSITIVISNVVADPNQCRVSYHRKVTNNGRTFKNQDYTFSLREVQKITIQTYEQAGNEYVAANNINRGVVSLSTSPQAVELSLRQNHGAGNFFNFTDTDLAERLAKAFNHAVELCGGGEKQELF